MTSHVFATDYTINPSAAVLRDCATLRIIIILACGIEFSAEIWRQTLLFASFDVCDRIFLINSNYAPATVRRRIINEERCVCLSVCLSVRPSVCRVPRLNSRTKRLRKSKMGRMEAHCTGNPWAYLEVKRSKVKVTKPIKAVTYNALANTPREAKRITAVLFNALMTIWGPYWGRSRVHYIS